MAWVAVIGAGGAIAGGLIANKGSKDAAKAQSQAGQLDPRIANMIFGENGQQGLLGQYQGFMDDPRSAAATSFAGANGDYLSQNGGADLGAIRQAALGVMGGNSAPMATSAQAGGAQMTAAQSPAAAMGASTASLPSYAAGNMVQAPGQNKMDLTGSYDSLINGQAGSNPHLTGAIQKGINQSSNAFGNMLTDAKSATQDVLGNIRGGAMMAGQFGGSRQGLAEGKAIDSMNTNLSRAASQFGQNNTDAAVAAQAGAYDADKNRQLSATQGLGAQQYGVASQDASTKNAAEFMNVGNQLDIAKTNAGLQQQANTANLGTIHGTNMANLGAAQQANQFNASSTQQNNQFNAGQQQQTNLANQGAQLTTNAQNNSAALGGGGLLSGLLGSASGTVNQNDNWGLDRAQQVNGMMSPYLTSSPTQNPVSSNSGAATLGGALGGLSLGNSLAGLFGGPSGATSLQTNGSAGSMPTGWAPSQLPVQSFGYGW